MRPHYAVYESNEEKAKKYDEVFKEWSRLYDIVNEQAAARIAAQPFFWRGLGIGAEEVVGASAQVGENYLGAFVLQFHEKEEG